MEKHKKKQLGIIWSIVFIISIISIITGIALPDLGWMGMLVTPFMIVLGVILTLTTQYFFIPLDHCPRCDTKMPTVYTQKCPKCGLNLITKCVDCDTYISTYLEGKPIKFCRKCGSQLKERIEEIEISDTLQQYIAREAEADTKFCPNCGIRLEREEILNFCPLCGGKLD